MATSADILDFWTLAGPPKWFAKNAAFDAEIANRFGADVEAAARAEFDSWIEEPDGALALIILLDQFPRNLFRDSPRAFATDAKALATAQDALLRRRDERYSFPLRRFFYLPMMHSERLEDQEFCIEALARLGDREGAEFGRIHRDIIAKFGRFPHRNAVLGRKTTPEEQAFLDKGGFAG